MYHWQAVYEKKDRTHTPLFGMCELCDFMTITTGLTGISQDGSCVSY